MFGMGAQAAYAAPASQDERAAGLWYADRLKFDDLQAMGATGEGVKIAVIDAAINPEAAELEGANIKVKGSYCAFPETGKPVPAVSSDVARSGHGTDVVSMLVGNGVAADGGLGARGIVPEAEVWFYASGLPDEAATKDTPGCEPFDGPNDEFYTDKNIEPNDTDYYLGRADAYAAWNAVNDGADIVVYSAGSGDSFGWSFTQRKALREDVPIVAATPNPDGDLDSVLLRVYPYSLNGAVAVSGVDVDGRLLNGGGGSNSPLSGDAQGSTNLGFLSAATALLTPSNDAGWEPSISYGNSLAAPLIAGTIALGMQMYPDATANQVLQVMIRTTGGEERPEPIWGGASEGYGIASPTAMLSVDPTSFPDENPLFVMSLDDPRCLLEDGTAPVDWDNCTWSNAPTPEEVWPSAGVSDPSTKAPSTHEPGASPLIPILFVVGGVFLLGVVSTAIVVPIVLSRSRKRRMQVPPSGP